MFGHVRHLLSLPDLRAVGLDRAKSSAAAGRGAQRGDDRRTLNAILFVLHTGILWNRLSKEPGARTPLSADRMNRQADGTIEHLWNSFLSKQDQESNLDWTEALQVESINPSKGALFERLQ